MRPLGFSSNAFKKDTLDHAIEVLAVTGYGAIELMADLHHAHPLALDAARRREIAQRVADHGLVVSNVNAFTHFVDGDTYHPTWFEADPERTQLRIDHTNRCLELAAEMGAMTVSVQPGGPVRTSGLTPAEAIERFAESLAQCLETARKCGVILAVEPEPGLLIESAGEYLGFKQRFFNGERFIRMNCDVGHLFCVGDDPAGVIRALPEEIAHVHLEDIGANRVHQHLAPGRGVIDFPAIFAALDAIDFAGHTTVELYPYETTAAGVARDAYAALAPLAAESRAPDPTRLTATLVAPSFAEVPVAKPTESTIRPAEPTSAPASAFASPAKPIGHDDE